MSIENSNNLSTPLDINNHNISSTSNIHQDINQQNKPNQLPPHMQHIINPHIQQPPGQYSQNPNLPPHLQYYNHGGMQYDLNKRNRRSKNDQDGRNYQCGCGKSQLSYPALQTHIRTKHNGMTPTNTTQPPSGKRKIEDGFEFTEDYNYNEQNNEIRLNNSEYFNSKQENFKMTSQQPPVKYQGQHYNNLNLIQHQSHIYTNIKSHEQPYSQISMSNNYVKQENDNLPKEYNIISDETFENNEASKISPEDIKVENKIPDNYKTSLYGIDFQEIPIKEEIIPPVSTMNLSAIWKELGVNMTTIAHTHTQHPLDNFPCYKNTLDQEELHPLQYIMNNLILIQNDNINHQSVKPDKLNISIDEMLCRQLLCQYSEIVYDFQRTLVGFICNLREALNLYGWLYIEQYYPDKMMEIKNKLQNTMDQQKYNKDKNLPEYCRINSTEFIPDLFNQFLYEYVPKQIDNFDKIIAEKIIKHLSNWLFVIGATKIEVKVDNIQDNKDKDIEEVPIYTEGTNVEINDNIN